MNISFISNLEAGATGGGFTLRNAAAFDALSNEFDAQYYGAFSPPSLPIEKTVSAIRRRLGARGAYHFFSKRRLQKIARDVSESGALAANALFFNGFTPWIDITPSVPYIAWNDCSFHDYVRIYNDLEQFSLRDIERIEEQEARWLKGARAVILRSRHFSERTIQQYNLDPQSAYSLGNFSTIQPPASDTYCGEPLFVFMSTNFHGKNGPVVLDAFQKLRPTHPQARLAVVGDIPRDIAQVGENVEWVGFLNPKDPEQNNRKRDLLAKAACLVHPTEFDTNPAVLVEAAYFGCPVISSKAFAIPEIVRDGETGFLLPRPKDVDKIVNHMAWMLSGSDQYYAMRSAARSHALTNLTLDRFKDDLVRIVANVLS